MFIYFFFAHKVPSDQTFLGKCKKLLLFDIRRDSKNEKMDRHVLIDSLNTLLIWNKEQIALNTQVYTEDGNKNRSMVKDLMEPFCC